MACFFWGSPLGREGSTPGTFRWDVAMAKIEDAYVKNFDDLWGWTTIAWMDHTEKGKEPDQSVPSG